MICLIPPHLLVFIHQLAQVLGKRGSVGVTYARSPSTGASLKASARTHAVRHVSGAHVERQIKRHL